MTKKTETQEWRGTFLGGPYLPLKGYIFILKEKKAQIIWMIAQNQFVKRSHIDVPSKEQNDQFGIHLSVPPFTPEVLNFSQQRPISSVSPNFPEEGAAARGW